MEQKDTKKVTAHLSADLLAKAQEATGENITKTLEMGLENIAHKKSYERLLALKGTYKFSLSLDTLREDRSLS